MTALEEELLDLRARNQELERQLARAAQLGGDLLYEAQVCVFQGYVEAALGQARGRLKRALQVFGHVGSRDDGAAAFRRACGGESTAGNEEP